MEVANTLAYYDIAGNQCDQIGRNFAVWLRFALAIFTFSDK
jgi:hypothetical protein